MRLGKFKLPTEPHGWFLQCTLAAVFMAMLLGGVGLLFTAPDQERAVVEIFTDPDGAIVQINGTVIGQTPIRYLLPEGEHEIIISKDGYQVVSRRIFAEARSLTGNKYTFGLVPTKAMLAGQEKAERIRTLKRQIEEALKRGDFIVPENASAWYYLNQLQELDPSDPMIVKLRESIRRFLKQQATTPQLRRHLS